MKHLRKITVIGLGLLGGSVGLAVSQSLSGVKTAGFSHMVSIETGDAKKFDASRVTAITAYLYPTLLAELSPKLKSVRVVGSPFHKIPGLAMVQSGDVWVYRK